MIKARIEELENRIRIQNDLDNILMKCYKIIINIVNTEEEAFLALAPNPSPQWVTQKCLLSKILYEKYLEL